jgi:hydroxyacylglutathione hydrolase
MSPTLDLSPSSADSLTSFSPAEGTPTQFWSSLCSLCALPDETLMYCAHEYTESNAKFAVTMEPGNAALQARVAEIASLRAQGKPTVPTSLALEKATNPFLRPHSAELRRSLGLGPEAPDVDVWAETRRRKDNFGGMATVIVNKVANLLYR